MDQKLYDLPDGWEWKKISEICTNITDGSHFSPKSVNEGKPYVTVKDVNDKGKIDLINCKKISQADFENLTKGNCAPLEGDVLLSKDGTVGKVALVTNKYEPFVVLSSLAIIRPIRQKLNSTFLKYFLLTPDFKEHAISKKTGAAIKRIVIRTIKEFHIPIPPLDEQKRIIKKLDTLLNRIDEAIRYLNESLELAEALFVSSLDKMFNPLGSTKNTEGVYDLPEGWEWLQLSEIGQIVTGKTPSKSKKEYYNAGKIPFIKPPCLQNKEKPEPAIEFITELGAQKSTIIPKNSLMVCCIGSLGKFSLTHEDSITNQQINTIIFYDNIAYYKYIFYYAYFLEKILNELANYAVVKIVNKTIFSKIKIPISPIDEQKRIVKKLDLISANNKLLKEKVQSQLDDLNALKASLLDAAFRGEL